VTLERVSEIGAEDEAGQLDAASATNAQMMNCDKIAVNCIFCGDIDGNSFQAKSAKACEPAHI